LEVGLLLLLRSSEALALLAGCALQLGVTGGAVVMVYVWMVKVL
jgi:hypothetical protein